MIETLHPVDHFGTQTLGDQGLRFYVYSDVLPYDAMLGESERQPFPRWQSAADEDRIADADETMDMSPWVVDMLPRLAEVAALADNWDSYGSGPPSPELIADVLLLLHRAERVLRHTKQFAMPAPNVVPLSGGGVQLEWHSTQKELELEFYEDRSPGALAVEIGSGLEVEARFDLGDHDTVRGLLAWLTVQ